jgi:hypothetical protein
MDSTAFRGLTAALLIFLLIIYFYNLSFTAYQIITGVALGIPQEREQEKEEERKQQYERSEQNRRNNESGSSV